MLIRILFPWRGPLSPAWISSTCFDYHLSEHATNVTVFWLADSTCLRPPRTNFVDVWDMTVCACTSSPEINLTCFDYHLAKTSEHATNATVFWLADSTCLCTPRTNLVYVWDMTVCTLHNTVSCLEVLQYCAYIGILINRS